MQHFDFNNPVCILTGEEFLPKPGMTFAKQILEFFQSQGGLAHSPWGEVLHETFLTEKIPEIAASSLVRGSSAASPQSQGNIAKILQRLLNSK